MLTDTNSDRKYVFVCGLPRSGTSMLGRNIGRLENCTSLKNTGVLEDEGRFLQDVYPTEREAGGPGRFGYDPRMHLTENSDVLTPENVARLLKSWDPYWDKSKRIYVEKTPANLLMTRFLQAAFPNSYFIVIRRHPVPASIATQKWKINVTSLYNLFRHWLYCHSLFEEDRKYLKHVYELKYENYIQDANRYHREIAAFIGTRVPEPPTEDGFRYVAQWRDAFGLRVPERTMEEPTGAHNKKYFDRWSYLLANSPFKSYYRYIARKYESSFAVYGYSLREGFGLSEKVQRDIGKGSNAIGTLFCIGADVYAAIWRAFIRSKKSLRLTVKAILPEFAIGRIRNARRSAYRRNEPPSGVGVLNR